MRQTPALLAASLILLSFAAAPAVAQEGRSLRFEKTVSYKTGQLMTLGAVVGQVRVSALDRSDIGVRMPSNGMSVHDT